MPQLIDSIDKIARQKQHDVLFVNFDYHCEFEEYDNYDEIFPSEDYRTWQVRQNFLHWLDEQKIPYQLCCSSYHAHYFGEIYLDVPYDTQNPQYQILSNYLEDLEGKPKIPALIFRYMPLNVALENAHQDDANYDPWHDE